MRSKLTNILIELKNHAPFTLFGAVTGISLMLIFWHLPGDTTYRLFYVFHPLHVTLSAIVTASLFRLHEKTKGFLTVLVIGYFGSIGVATLSDSIIPYFGESILGVAVPTEAQVHGGHQYSSHDANDSLIPRTQWQHYRPKAHVGFIEEWFVVSVAAFVGIGVAYLAPHTKLPHAGHILVSTWASAAHIMMNTHSSPTVVTIVGSFVVLFLAVWLPCCFSDIVFPMLFVGSGHAEQHVHHTCQKRALPH